MNVVDPITQARIQAEVVFTEVRPQPHESSSKHEGEVVGKENFGTGQKAPSKSIVTEGHPQIVIEVAYAQSSVGSEHTVLKYVFVVVIDIVQADIESLTVCYGGSTIGVGDCAVGSPVAEIQNEIGGIAGETVGGQLESVSVQVSSLASVNDGVTKTEIILSQSGFCINRKGSDEE